MLNSIYIRFHFEKHPNVLLRIRKYFEAVNINLKINEQLEDKICALQLLNFCPSNIL